MIFSLEKKERKRLTPPPCQRPQPARFLLLLVCLSVVSSSLYTTDVSSSSYALTRPSFSPFLFEPSVTTVDKAKDGDSSGWDRREEGVMRGRRNERR